jgi:RNA polymerase sigma-70 factor (ECF subfamily)
MVSDDCESDLIRLAAAGDRASLSQLLLIHYDELSRHVAARVSSELQGLIRPEDILQQTFVRAAQAIGAFQPRHEGAFRAWLKTIAANLVKDAEKRRRRERRAGPHRVRSQLLSNESSGAPFVEKLAQQNTTPGGRAQRRENIRCLQAAVAKLPTDQREVIQRYYIQDQSLEQIAQAMDRTKDAVRGICYRARRNLRAIMGQSSLYFSG